MVDPEIQIINVEISTDHAADSEPDMVYPDLFQFLKQTPWKQMNALMLPHGKYIDDFRSRFETDAESDMAYFVRCKVDITKNIVKLILMESELHILTLKVSNLEEKTNNKISAENLEKTLERKVFCLTPGLELVEPTQMVEGDPRYGFITVPRGFPLPQGPSVLRGHSVQRGHLVPQSRLVPRSSSAPRFHPSKFQPQVRPLPRTRPVPGSHPNKYQPDGKGNF